MLNRRLFLALAAAVLLPVQAWAEDRKLEVVATTGMIADTAMRIGGDAVTIKALMGPGVDPHAYRQTRTDIVVGPDILLDGLGRPALVEHQVVEVHRDLLVPFQSIAHQASPSAAALWKSRAETR